MEEFVQRCLSDEEDDTDDEIKVRSFEPTYPKNLNTVLHIFSSYLEN